ncbi:hypothetical protein B0H13DRAFT_2345876 [Mycena leptocephala]|nr:hypothetical protein B0H13DRAFT_2345876 [Mycena leptocephala]
MSALASTTSPITRIMSDKNYAVGTEFRRLPMAVAVSVAWSTSVHMEQGPCSATPRRLSSASTTQLGRPTRGGAFHHEQVLQRSGESTEFDDHVFIHIGLALQQYKSSNLANSIATFRRMFTAFPPAISHWTTTTSFDPISTEFYSAQRRASTRPTALSRSSSTMSNSRSSECRHWCFTSESGTSSQRSVAAMKRCA